MLKYLETMIKIPSSRIIIMPNLDDIENSPFFQFLTDDIFFMLRLTKTDLRTFNDDPVE